MAGMMHFSKREIDVIGLLLQGKSNKQIALLLAISEHTVEFHLKNIYDKLGVSSRTEAILVLGKTSAWKTGAELGESAVEGGRQIAENEDSSALPGQGMPANQATKTQKPAKFFKWLKLLIPLGILLVGGLVYMITRPTAWESYQRECEYPDQATVGQLIWRSNASGSSVHGQFGTTAGAPWPAQPGFVVYKGISIPQAGQLYLKIRYSKNTPSAAPILVYLDDEPEPRASLFLADQHDWDQFAWTEAVSLNVVENGVHSLKLTTAGQDYGVADLDKLELTKHSP